jgi:hypothetical protein
MYNTTTTTYPATEEEVEELKTEFDRSKHAYLDQPFVHFENLKPMVAPVVEEPVVEEPVVEEDEELESSSLKQAIALWKHDHPTDTLKEQRRLFNRGIITAYPWNSYKDDPRIQHVIDFGRRLPANAFKGDQFVLLGTLPTRLYKFNGNEWIEINKNDTDTYTHNSAYIDHLIAAISAGQYDAEMLTDGERTQIENKLRQDNK